MGTDHSTPSVNEDRAVIGSLLSEGTLGEIERVALVDSSVLLTGETGTGKTTAARLLHKLSRRSTERFVRVDCAGLVPSLIESELFGHEKGAFTGAYEKRLGRFELAGRGTILLDEIGDLELPIQLKLLRILDDREFERVGGNQTLSLRSRVIAATNRDLDCAVQLGSFRADLLYRLSRIRITLPALRYRPREISSVFQQLLVGACEKFDRNVECSAPAIARLLEYEWPGNLREMANVVEGMVLRARGNRINVEDVHALLPDRLLESGRELNLPRKSLVEHLRAELLANEREQIVMALSRSSGNVAAAARDLGVARSTLRNKLVRHQLSGS